MNNRQFKDAFLRSKVSECLTNARLCILSRVPASNFSSIEDAKAAQRQATRALAFARQLSPTQTNRAVRAHLVQVLEAIGHV